MFLDAASYSTISQTSVVASILLAFGLTQLSSGFLKRPLQDQSSLIKKMQFLAGVSPTVYWSAKFTSDLLFWTLAMAGVLLVMHFLDFQRMFFDYEAIG